LSQESPEWQIGDAAAYMEKWKAWFKGIPADGRDGYKKVFAEVRVYSSQDSGKADQRGRALTRSVL
jgi:hypothetical protein